MIPKHCCGPAMQSLLLCTALVVLLSGVLVRATLVDGRNRGSLRKPTGKNGDGKVVVELYYESQCPGCREVLTGSFFEAFSTEGFLDMAEVVLVPYGNAVESGPDEPSGTFHFECQHGPSECTYNAMEACALDKIESPTKAFSFLYCVETSDENREPDQDYDAVATKCALSAGLEGATEEAIRACYLGAEGNALVHSLAERTAALDPPHTYVPWIVADGVHSDDLQDRIGDSLLDYVCSAYGGPNPKPRACTPLAGRGEARVRSDEKRGERRPRGPSPLCHRGGLGEMARDE